MLIRRAKAQEALARWEALMQAVERPYAKAVLDEKVRYIHEASTVFPSTHRLTDQGFDYHRAAMVEIGGRYQTIAIRIALREALKSVKSRAASLSRKEDWEKLWLYLAHRWVSEWGAARAREAAGTTRADMQRIIDAALSHDEEFNPQRVATELLKVVGISAYRAAVISRTETHAAMMYASQEGAAKVGRDDGLVLRKKWIPVQDERTRISHASMSGVAAIPMDADFTVGGEKMARPGDPRGSAGNTINCRCVLAYEVEE